MKFSLIKYGLVFFLGTLLAAGLIWCSVLFQLGTPNPTTLRTRDLAAFKKHKAQTTESPKLLICAGSSAFAGLRSDLIQAHLNIPTVSLAMAGSLGITTSCRWGQEYAKPGDTILLAFEYDTYDWDDFSGRADYRPGRFVRYNVEYADYTISYEPQTFRSMGFMEQAKIIISLPNKRIFDGLIRTLKARVRHTPQEIPGIPDDINETGDAMKAEISTRPAHISLDRVDDALLHGIPDNAAGFLYLRPFITWCHEHGVTVVATWPNVVRRPEHLTPSARLAIGKIQKFYESMGVPIIGSYEEAMLPQEQFYDTIYHLLHKPAEERTLRLLQHWPGSDLYRSH